MRSSTGCAMVAVVIVVAAGIRVRVRVGVMESVVTAAAVV